ncbi:MAG: hypothetical protein WAV76_11530 [Bacteroidota bacterium]
MADSTIATRDVENWIRKEFLPKKYHQAFAKRKLGVQSGGEFECDAVSENGGIVCFISTSSRKTISGKYGAGKFAKIRADAYWALSLKKKPQKILFAFTDKSMVELVKQEQKNGRFPEYIEALPVTPPIFIKKKLAKMKKKAAEEVSKQNRESEEV